MKVPSRPVKAKCFLGPFVRGLAGSVEVIAGVEVDAAGGVAGFDGGAGGVEAGGVGAVGGVDGVEAGGVGAVGGVDGVTVGVGVGFGVTGGSDLTNPKSRVASRWPSAVKSPDSACPVEESFARSAPASAFVGSYPFGAVTLTV